MSAPVVRFVFPHSICYLIAQLMGNQAQRGRCLPAGCAISMTQIHELYHHHETC